MPHRLPRDPRPLAGLLLGAAALANLGALYGILTRHDDLGPIPWEGGAAVVILLAMLQGWSGAQALEGRRLAVARAATALSALEGVLLPVLGVRDPLVWGPAAAAALLGAGAVLLLLPRKGRAVANNRSTTL